MKYWKIAVMRNAGRNVVSSHRGLTRLFYNAMGGLYDTLYHRLIRGYVDSAQTLMEDLVREGDWVLDVGCGTGLLSYLAAPRAGRVVGVDLSVGMLQKARRKRRSEQPVFFVNGDALRLPIEAKFDCCVSAFMLVMLPRELRWKTIAEMERLLKPGGRIAFLTSREEFGAQWESAEEWREGLKSLGFTQVRVIEKGDVFLNVVALKPAEGGVESRFMSTASLVHEDEEDLSALGEGVPALVS
ncbi:MAG: Ubiquinone/menaquinone biosynthesis C-methyltransferase UbiE [bacterium]|nr:Ubiquinone/menaquinone biosynthesis C-methyltransferase UbiE [bacterium]